MNSIYDVDNEQDPLQNQYNALRIQWNSIRQATSRSNRRNSTVTPTTATVTDHQLYQMYDNSPKELMSSLQNENSPSEDHPGNRDQAAIEIIKQREADFDNFPIRGRRLFEESQGESLDISQESEVSTQFSDKGSETGHEKQNQNSGWDTPAAEKNVTLALKGRSVGGGGSRGRGGGFVGRWMLCLLVMLFALGIVAFKCSGKDEQRLVPT